MEDTIVRVHDLPWGELGTDVEGITDLAAIREAAGLNYEVDQVPVFTGRPGHNPGYLMGARQVPNRHGIVRTDTGQPLGVSGNYFKPIQNAEADWMIEGLMASDVLTPVRAGTTHGGARTFIVGTYNGEHLIGGIDPVDTFFALWNRHDGRGSLTAAILHVRRFCANQLPGIVTALAHGTLAGRASKNRQRLFQWKVRHTAKFLDRIDAVREAMNTAHQANEVFTATANALILRPWTADDMAEVVGKLFPVGDNVTAKTAKANADKGDQIMAVWQNADNLDDVRFTAWGGWNAVAEYADHLTPFRNTKTSTRAESRFLSITDPDGTATKLKVAAYDKVAQKAGVGDWN